jgi:hypothetical protein
MGIAAVYVDLLLPHEGNCISWRLRGVRRPAGAPLHHLLSGE